jgi:hypothetical protein
LKSSYTLETSVYQLVTCKKCKMAVKARALIYRRADGERGQILGSPDIWSDELCSVLNGAY